MSDTTGGIDLQQLLASLTAPQAPPVPPAVDYAATAPTSASSLFGESLAGGPPSAFPLSQAQREVEGNRDLLGFARGLMSGGPFARGGDVIAGGLQGAAGAQANAELAAAGQQQAAQEWQNTTQANRIEQLKAVLPLLQTQMQLQMTANAKRLLLGGGGATTPGAPGTSTAIASTIAKAGGDPYAAIIAGREGTGGNPNSSAAGYGQFLASTWGNFAKANPDLFKGMTQDQILAARNDPAMAAKAIDWLTRQNAGTLTAQGVTPSGQSLGMSHYLGAGTVAKMWGAPDTDPVSKYVGDAAVKANPELGTMTVGQMKARYAGMPNPSFLGGAATAAAAPPAGPTAPPAAPAVAPGVTMAAPGVAPPPPPGPGAVGPVAGIGAALNPAAAAATLPVPPIPPSPDTIVTKGTPIPAGRLQSTGKPPAPPPTPRKMSDADIVMQGIRTAQATPVQPGAPLAAGGNIGQPAPLAGGGPAPNVWGAPAPPSAVLNYNGGAPTTVGPTTPAPQPGDKGPPPAPPALVTQPGGQPPTLQQPTAPPTFTPTRLPLPPDLQARIDNPLTPEQSAQYDRGIASATTTQEAEAAAQAKNAAIADARAKAVAAGEEWQEKRSAEQLAVWQTNQGSANKIKEIQAQGQTASEGKVIDALNTTQTDARTAIDQLSLARSLSRQAGDPTFWQTVQTNHPDLVRALANLGGLDPDQVQQLGAAGAMDAAFAKLVTLARAGSGFQRVTNMDLQLLQSQAPKGTDPQGWREAKLAYLQSYMERQVRYVDTVHALMGSGVKLYDAQKQADTDAGAVVPQIPTFQDTPQQSAAQQRTDWANRNVAQNSFFRAPDGQLVIWPPPPQRTQ